MSSSSPTNLANGIAAARDRPAPRASLRDGAPSTRVLHLGKYYPPYRGGIESHLQLLCGELQRHSDVDLDVLVCSSDRTSRVEHVDGVRVTRCFELAHVASTSLCPTMPLELSRRKYDVLHIHFPHPMGVMSYLFGWHGHPHKLVVGYHSDIVKQARLLKMYRPFMDRVLERADAIIAGSPAYLESSKELTRHRAKCHVIPYGLDLADAEVTPEIARAAEGVRARWGKGRPIVLGVGRLVYYKGFDYLVRAMRDVDATLLIVGTGPMRSALEAIAREAGVADRVAFLGEVDTTTLRACYEACDVFTLSSVERSEAFAIVQLEAMAHGKPIVNTAIPGSGVPWVSRDGESGLTVPPKDSAALATAIRTLLTDRALATRLGRGGRARVERDFSKEATGRKMLDLYRSL